MIDLDAIRRAHPLPAVAAALVKLRPSGNEWLGCCPFHADNSPSFTIYDAGRRFQCFGCGAGGDVLDFVQRAHGVTLPEAARMLDGGQLPSRVPPPGAGIIRPIRARGRATNVLAIWNRAVPAAGTLAEAYLRQRGINPPFPPALRFLALPCDGLGPVPCMIGAVQDVAGGVTGIQRIWLAPDGLGKAAVAKPKRSLGRIKGGAIRLGVLDGSGVLTVCEGPEDGLSLLEMLGGPVWVASGTSFLPAMQFPVEVRSIVIGADNDAAGREAADKAALAYASRGLSVRIIRPLERFKDFNDELRGANHG